jgi:ribosomal protein S18 acetylase RimI-like enzyme
MCSSDDKHPSSNFFFACRTNGNGVLRAEEAAKRSGVCSGFILPSDDFAADYEVFQRAGFVSTNDLMLMSAPRQKILDRLPPKEFDAVLQRVDGLRFRHDWVLYLAGQFFSGAERGFLDGLARVTASAPNAKLYRFEKAGRIIGGGMTYATPGVLGLYNIAINLRDRGMGHGQHLTRALIETNGSPELTLQCNPGLVGWYEQMGFEPLGAVRVLRFVG